MRFGDWDRARADATAAERIDYRCFVAALAAVQAATPTARVAGKGTPAPQAEIAPAASANGSTGGSFHPTTARALAGNPLASKVKPAFTVALQPSFNVAAVETSPSTERPQANRPSDSVDLRSE